MRSNNKSCDRTIGAGNRLRSGKFYTNSKTIKSNGYYEQRSKRNGDRPQ